MKQISTIQNRTKVKYHFKVDINNHKYHTEINELYSDTTEKYWNTGWLSYMQWACFDIPYGIVPDLQQPLQKSMPPLAFCHTLVSHLHASGIVGHPKCPLASVWGYLNWILNKYS